MLFLATTKKLNKNQWKSEIKCAHKNSITIVNMLERDTYTKD